VCEQAKHPALKEALLTLEKVIQTPIPWYFKLGPNAHSGASRLGNGDALEDPLHISLFLANHLKKERRMGRDIRVDPPGNPLPIGSVSCFCFCSWKKGVKSE
jgi:hypothetical protein